VSLESKIDQVLQELKLIRERLEALERALGEELSEGSGMNSALGLETTERGELRSSSPSRSLSTRNELFPSHNP